MSKIEQSEIYQQIQQAQNLKELGLIKTEVASRSDLLLAEFEELILDKITELLSDKKEHYWCNQEEFSFLINGLGANPKLNDKYKNALTLAMNMGMTDFKIFSPTLKQFVQENGNKLKSFNTSEDIFPLLEESKIIPSRIRGTRRAIEQQANGLTSESNSKRRHEQSKSPESIPKIDQLPFKKIINNLHQLSLVALQCRNSLKQLVVLRIFEDLSIDKPKKDQQGEAIEDYCDLFDVIKFTHIHHPDLQVRQQAQYVLETFTSLGAYVAEDMIGRTNDLGEVVEIISVNPNEETSQSELQANVKKSIIKVAILEKIFEQSSNTLSDDRKFDEILRFAGFNSRIEMAKKTDNLPVFCEKIENYASDPLANELIKFAMEKELDLLKKEGDFGGFVIPSQFAQNQENSLLTWRGNITRNDLDKLDPASILELKANLPHLLNTSTKPLEIAEMAAIVTFLRPELDLDETTPLTELKDQARGGMFPISKRGISVKLDQSQGQDKLLAQIGLKQLTFRRTTSPHNLEVSLQLSKRAFVFEINEQMETPALFKLAPAERAWVERVVFSYLLAIKNRDLYQTSAVVSKQTSENQATETRQTEDHQRKEATNSSHLYVLPYSYQPKDWDDPNSFINLEVKEEFGYSLLELNLHFSLAQQNLKYLDDLKDRTLRRIILSSLKRLEDKTNPENWNESRVQTIKAQIKEIMLGTGNSTFLTNEKDDNPENIALIGFKHEPIDPAGPPLQIKLSEVSNRLFNASV